MSTAHPADHACCTIPAVQVDYTAKGTHKPRGAFDSAYVTGDNSEIALIVVYDIFGYSPQTLQGADILAESIGAQIFIPDFFGEGNAFSIEKIPPKNDQDRKDLRDFIQGAADPHVAVEKLIAFAKILRGEGFKKIGALGYCWGNVCEEDFERELMEFLRPFLGGKIIFLSGSKEGSLLDAISAVHPSALTAQDAVGLTVPLGLYASGDESRDEFDKILKLLSKERFAAKVDSKYYQNMFHGWAAARGDLSDPENKREYEDVYSRASAFFKNAFT